MHVYKQLKYFLSSSFLQNVILQIHKLKASLKTLIKIISCENIGKKTRKNKFCCSNDAPVYPIKLDSFEQQKI